MLSPLLGATQTAALDTVQTAACSIQFPIRTNSLSQMAPWRQGREGLLHPPQQEGYTEEAPFRGLGGWRREGDRGPGQGLF